MYSISLLGPDSLIDIFPKEKKIVKKLKCSSMKAPSINIQSLDIYSVCDLQQLCFRIFLDMLSTIHVSI